ncbi:RimJ/RimL family protein N-acetyltransferase [Streptomyces phaeochromogenes]|jgi:RimJ/RimL family protein N-acetyltransferase|uniref:GNAT family N-acetyltransferase n=1 Tax=Streptomyces phaeochromogenes TaxID=1923 RepID=UPI00278F5E35|nr:GNAT family N-acetyltransferase [Streptomyces phaeochromogenes]MDQ0955288.1 RimJ/RimL family protein N-acetyltransferase [Streptomyces phaeochromogenes]
MEPIRREDSDDLFEAVVSQESVMRWLATGRADSRSAAEAMCDEHVAHWTRHGYGDFAVRDAATHAFLGRVGLRNRARYGVDLGFALHPRAQGRGVAGEAGRACLDLAFRRLSLPAVFGFVLPGNTASIAVLRRLGAQADGAVQSSGLHCLRYRFDPAATATAEHVVDNGCADLQLVHAPGPGSPDDHAALRDGQSDPFGVNGLGLVWADQQHTLTAVSEGRPVASAGWLLRDMAFDGLPRRAVGLGGLLVHPAHRGKGIARTLISVAVEHARAAGAETMMLLCHPDLIPLCTQLGWSRLSVPVAVRQPDGPRTSPLTTMIYDLAGLPHPTISVDLRGLPF